MESSTIILIFMCLGFLFPLNTRPVTDWVCRLLSTASFILIVCYARYIHW